MFVHNKRLQYTVRVAEPLAWRLSCWSSSAVRRVSWQQQCAISAQAAVPDGAGCPPDAALDGCRVSVAGREPRP